MPEALGAKPPAPNPKQVSAAGADKIFGTTKTAPTILNVPQRGRNIFKNKMMLIPLGVLLLGLIGTAVWFFVLSGKGKTEPVETNAQNQQPQADPEVTTPADWLARYFGSDTCTNLNRCGDKADPDYDGLSNKEEHEKGTDPNNADSDGEGIADGDEVHIFLTEPLISKSYRDGDYNDADFAKGGYDIRTNVPYTETELIALKARIQERGLHQPTLTTIGSLAITLYDFRDPNATDLSNLNIDLSPQAKLDRDTQRQSTIKKIGGALLKYKAAQKTYPQVLDFLAMSEAISTYNTVATNYSDPINHEKYVYGYSVSNNGMDFTLTYFSETQEQLIKYTAKNAEDTAAKDAALINDQQRISDLENIKSALMVFSSANTDSNSDQINVFPTPEQYPHALLGPIKYISAIPKDPNGSEYVYSSSTPFDNFSLKAVFQSPPAGFTGYQCTADGCKNF